MQSPQQPAQPTAQEGNVHFGRREFRLDEAITYRTALTWLSGAIAALVFGAIAVGNSIVARAEMAAASQVASAAATANTALRIAEETAARVDGRLDRIEAKVDQLLMRGGR